MSTTTLDAPAASAITPGRGGSRPVPDPIPFSRVVSVELRKMFDTRSGFWLLAGIGIVATVATVAVVIFAPDSSLTYESFATAIGAPMSILLPIVAILSVTSEWSQRNGLTTFTLVPHRGRVIAAKAVCAVGVGLVSMVLAALIGAAGNVVGSALAGVDTSWNVSWSGFALIVLSNVLGLLIGFTLGVLIRNSAGAIVGYFVFSALLPTITSSLASAQEWYRENGPWFDYGYAASRLYGDSLTGEQWAQLGTASLIWLVIPLAVGLFTVLRAEVK